jgi:L-alanine-DL-glutamate epimerase-like enolase superfamily enzyme
VPPHGIYNHAGSPADINRMVNAIREARKRVGPSGAVMFDAHCAVPPATLIQLAGAPEGNGLGVEMDEKAMAKVAALKEPKFRWPVIQLEDGSMADY